MSSELDVNAWIIFSKGKHVKFIFFASSNVSSTAQVFNIFSFPVKSTKINVIFLNYHFLNFELLHEYNLLENEFNFVSLTILLSCAKSTYSIKVSNESTHTSVNLSI